MPTGRYELLSLPGWTRAECLKMIFHLAGQHFYDHRITINEWKAYKSKMCLPPDARLPILRVDNCTIVGTLEIGRYLSRQFGFYANSTIEQSQIEELIGEIEALHVLFLPIIRATFQRNNEMRMFHWLEFKQGALLPVLDFLTRRLGQNDYFVSNRVTFAEIAICELLAKFSTLCDPQLLCDYPSLAALLERIEQINEPNFQKYLAQRSRNFF